MNISAQELHKALRMRYPKAEIHLLDEEYELPTKDMIEGAYSKFQASMWKVRLTNWILNKLDCDKWAWLFKAHVTVRNALSANANAQPIGILCYFIEGDAEKGHCINNVVWGKTDHSGFYTQEVEPLPKGGLKLISQKERDSVWLIVM